MKCYNCGKPEYIKRNCRQSNKNNQRTGYAQATQQVSKEELDKILKQVSSPTPTKQLEEEDLEDISDYELMDIEECAGTQIRDWQPTIIKDKRQTPIIPEDTKSEEIDWEAIQ